MSTKSGFKSVFVYAALFGACLPVLIAAAPADAGEKVGRASYVRNKVTGKIQTQVVDISQGEDIFGREVVRTVADSQAKVVLKDDSNLAIGPNSSVTIDDFVYAGPADFKKATFTLGKGALRFTSGASDTRAYDIRTPNATIGVRG